MRFVDIVDGVGVSSAIALCMSQFDPYDESISRSPRLRTESPSQQFGTLHNGRSVRARALQAVGSTIASRNQNHEQNQTEAARWTLENPLFSPHPPIPQA